MVIFIHIGIYNLPVLMWILAIIIENIPNPKSINLHRNYPIPFNPITIIEYDIPAASNVNVTIYDMMGRQVKKHINKYHSSGYKPVIWNATNNQGQPIQYIIIPF